jgi:hypothetical protein
MVGSVAPADPPPVVVATDGDGSLGTAVVSGEADEERPLPSRHSGGDQGAADEQRQHG